MQRARHTPFVGVGVHALFKACGGVGGLTERAGSFPNVVAGELRRLEEHVFRIGFYFAVQAAHNARERDGSFAVADHEVVFREREFLFVEGDDLLPLRRSAYDDLSAAEVVRVERVHRLTHFEEYEVRNIDDRGNGTYARKRKAFPHPSGRTAALYVLHVMPYVARAKVGREDFHFHGRGFTRMSGKGIVGGFERFMQHRRDFAGDTQNTLTIGAVRRHGDVENPVVQTDDLLDILAHGRVFCKVEKSVDLRAGIEIVVYPQFLARTEHTERLHAAELAFFDLLHAVGVLFEHGGVAFHHCRAVERAGRFHAHVDVGRARHDLQVAAVFRAAVNRTYLHMVAVGMGRQRFDFADDHAVYFRTEVGKFLHLEPAREQLIRKFLRGDVYIHIIF